MRSELLGIVERLAFSETKEEMSKTQPSEMKKDGGGSPAPACTLPGNLLGGAALRREQLETNHLRT
jgi:hypothetical protein